MRATLSLIGAGCGVAPDGTTFPTDEGLAPGVLCETVLTGRVDQDERLGPPCRVRLVGRVDVGDPLGDPAVAGPTLTLEAGTEIVGEAGTDARLVVHRGARLVTEGREDAPVVFTSSAPPGTRQPGDWGGVVLNGAASSNAAAVSEIPGLGLHGGSDDEGDSGQLAFVRIEFAGATLPDGSRLAGLGLYGVGSSTVIDHVQVHRAAGDGIEVRGGTVGLRRVLVSGSGQDGLDWTEGWRGRAQWLVLQQLPDGGDNGIEGDNSALDNDLEPRSAPVLSQVTVIGPRRSSDGDVGVLFRQGTAGELRNAIVAAFDGACITVANVSTQLAVQAGELVVSDVILDCPTLVNVPDKTVMVLPVWDNVFATDLSVLVEGFQRVADPAFCTVLTGAVTPLDPFFEPSPVFGGCGVSDPWTDPWTTSAVE